MVYLFLADGFEEIEALAVVDLLRRAEVEIQTVSIMGRKNVMGGHNIEVNADILFEDIVGKPEMIILPGGIPGTPNLKKHAGLDQLLRESAEDPSIYMAAICAAPTVYGEKGLLGGKKATCYPGLEEGLVGAEAMYDKVVVDGKFITSRGAGTAVDFGLALIKILKDENTSNTIAEKIVY